MVVEVPEPKPTDQIREKSGIAVVVATTLCSTFPVLYMLAPDSSKFYQISNGFSFFGSLQEEFLNQRANRQLSGPPAPADLLHFHLAPC